MEGFKLKKILKNLKKAALVFISAIIAFTIILLNGNIVHTNVVYGNERTKDSKSNDAAVRYGDVDANGVIDIGDGITIKKHLANIPVTIDNIASDVNCNGNIDTTDAVLLMKHLAGMEVELGVLQQPTDPETQPSIPEVVKGKTLIVYFSWSSNTQRMANTIKEQTGGDILEIVPVNAYPTDYTKCTEVTLEERDNNARPAIQNLPDSIEKYDNILIGYPKL